jgi:hypothetical protein
MVKEQLATGRGGRRTFNLIEQAGRGGRPS